MDSGGSKVPGKPDANTQTQSPTMKPVTAAPRTPISVTPSAKGVENAKKRLRAFSIQKKTPLTPVVTPKPTGSGNTMVLIGKLSSVKVTPKTEDQEPKQKLPKPPKPGAVRKALQDSYTELQRRTLADIEDMKRKMELVDLGIPLGLICPTSTSEKAMPTKAMPPIKSFIDPAKVDELIREAKKAKMEGREFKFDYQKLLPGYDNPFQNKKKEEEKEKEKKASEKSKSSDYKDRRKSDKYSSKRYAEYRKEDKYKERDRNRPKERDKQDKPSEHKTSSSKDAEKTTQKETDVNLNDYLVCDSWSLDNDEKTSSSSPKFDEKSDSQSSSLPESKTYIEPSDILKASRAKKNELIKTKEKQPIKLQPVIDSFKYEIDDNEEEVLDIFDADSNLEKFAKVKSKKLSLYDSPVNIKLKDDLDDSSRDLSLDGLNDDTFLESVINEIKVGELSDDSQDKGLVEYDISPPKDDDTPKHSNKTSKSVTPELISKKDRKQSDYSDGYRSSESGYKTSDTLESGYKSETEFRLSIEKELDDALNASKMSKETVDSLETWSFVLKICQPLLFRHDKNKCYKETRAEPKLWWTTNPKGCSCVKDRSIVYEELEACKMSLVDRVYGCDQISDEPFPKCRNWYPGSAACLVEGRKLQLSSEWEGEDSQQAEISLDREYQRFMEAVWPDAMDSKKEVSRSTTPVQENRKKRKEGSEEKKEDEKKAKKMKLSSEGWSQESDVEEEDKSKKVKTKEKSRKRKHSTSMSSSPSDSEEDAKRKKKALKKKAMKKAKSKSAKKRRMGKKLLKKLKEKEKKSKKMKERDISDDDSDSDKKEKKSKKKKQEKAKKREKKKKKAKAKSSSSDSTSSDSSSESSDSDRRKKKKTREKTKKKKKSETQEELFDVNILNNIKTEKTTDDEGSKLMEFSPRRQKPREIINVKELQNDFVGNNMIKKEVEEKTQSEVQSVDDKQENDNEVVVVKEQSEVNRDEGVEREREASKEREDVSKGESEVKVVEGDSQSGQEKIEEIKHTFKEPQHKDSEPMAVSLEDIVIPEESVKVDDNSQCSSQDSVCSVKDVTYEKEESPGYELPARAHGYELYEQLALAQQRDVAHQPPSPVDSGVSRIETVVRARCGEIKCDWRAPAGDDAAPARPARPSRWGLKPGEVNIVLTGGEPVYRIQSLANRTDNQLISYDEAYMDTYGASDRLQYGDCFSTSTEPATFHEQPTTEPQEKEEQRSTLDDRINQALRETVLGDVAKELDTAEADKEEEKGILTKNAGMAKRVRFADGYAPGQDSDTEPPPKRRRVRRTGCAWPCPATHPDHVSLWDALPPPPPPPGSPPRIRRPDPVLSMPLGGFMPPEPPPGLIALH